MYLSVIVFCQILLINWLLETNYGAAVFILSNWEAAQIYEVALDSFVYQKSKEVVNGRKKQHPKKQISCW